MATKPELEKQVKLLKEEIRKLRGEAKQLDSNLAEMPNSAHGIIQEGGQFKLVSLKFDAESAVIKEVKDIGKDKGMAAVKVRTAVIDNLIKITKRR